MKLSRDTSKYDSNFETESQGASIKADVHMIRIMSGQLYSDPLLAMVREILCNALDAHEEAKQIEKTPVGWARNEWKPIEVILPTEMDPTLTIKDWGIGLSEKEVLLHTTTFGESTKRDTNDSIGGFGLGMKAPMANTAQYTIIRRGQLEDGSWKETTFSISADPEKGFEARRMPLRKNLEKPERGITVKIPIESAKINKVRDNVYKVLRWFPEEKWTITNGDREFKFNETFSVKAKIKKDSTEEFTLCRCGTWYEGELGGADYRGHAWESIGRVYAVMGNVLYQIPNNLISDINGRDYNLRNLGSIYLFFPLGALTLTPSRESLFEDEKTKKNVKVALRVVCEKIFEHLKTEVDQLGDDLWDYLSSRDLYSDDTSQVQINSALIVLMQTIHRSQGLQWDMSGNFEVLTANRIKFDTKSLKVSEVAKDEKGNTRTDWNGVPLYETKLIKAKLESFELYSLTFKSSRTYNEVRDGPFFSPQSYFKTVFWRKKSLKRSKARAKKYFLDNEIDLPTSRYSSNPSVLLITVNDDEGDEKKVEQYLKEALKCVGNPSDVVDLNEWEPYEEPKASTTAQGQQSVTSQGRSPAYIYVNSKNAMFDWEQKTEFPTKESFDTTYYEGTKSGKSKVNIKGFFYVFSRNYTMHREDENTLGVLREQLCETKDLGGYYEDNYLGYFRESLYSVSGLDPRRFPFVIVPYSRRGQFRKHLKENPEWIEATSYLERRIPQWLRERKKKEKRAFKVSKMVSELKGLFDFIPVGTKSSFCEEVKEKTQVLIDKERELNETLGIHPVNHIVKSDLIPKEDSLHNYSSKNYQEAFFQRYPALKCVTASAESVVKEYIEDMDELWKCRGDENLSYKVFNLRV